MLSNLLNRLRQLFRSVKRQETHWTNKDCNGKMAARVVLLVSALVYLAMLSHSRAQCPTGVPLVDDKGEEYFCGRGSRSRVCPEFSECHIDPRDIFAVCCLV
ncbi:uncharacterized protein [Haliotis cracherodii]|uniref:uncharacterized protein n=1 Tax=Haliotis cracherodii TaxID=6455 RepID=UPI0039E850BE